MREIIQKDLISLDVDKINFDDKESVKSLIITLLNVVEQLLQENRQLRVELQLSRDENARLKGEKSQDRDNLDLTAPHTFSRASRPGAPPGTDPFGSRWKHPPDGTAFGPRPPDRP